MGYKHIDLTFSEDNENEMKLYKFIQENSTLLGKSKYIKQIIYKEYKSSHK